MMGYINNEKATKETVNEDRWLMTGDICQRDSNGFYSITDRKKELVKYKGYVLYQRESVLLHLGGLFDNFETNLS